VFNIGHWQPRIGDPSFIGWFTVFSYYFCAGLSFACVLKARPRMDGMERRIRMAMTGLLIVHGLSKHFNLPAAVTEIGRIVAHWIGGYDLRRWLQVLMLLLVAIGLVLLIRWSVRRKSFLGAWRRCAPEMICLCCLCGLVILRAISLHQAGALLATEVFGVRLSWIVELSGIYSLVVILLRRMLGRTDGTDSVR
jgi:hypothetical protein